MEWKKVLAFTLALAMICSSTPMTAFALDENTTMQEGQSGAEQGEQTKPEGEHKPDEGEQTKPEGAHKPDEGEQTKPEGEQKPEESVTPMQPLEPAKEVVLLEEEVAEGNYELYPKPHEIVYRNGNVKLESTVDVVFEDGIDGYTEQRAKDALGKVEASLNEVKTAEEADLLVGIYNNADTTVDDWFKQQFGAKAESDFDVFEKTDSYMLVVKDGKIGVLGKDTDAAFYGLTTLRQILQQTDNQKIIQDLEVKDWADVASRGFIEGYYGEPWSTEDRMELMRWGGSVKLNSYFYAPKDDPKHNKNWREKYTEEELKEKIEPLAKVGNESKCKFVFALHPFMSNPITNANYDQSVQVLKEKFEQVIGAGVRQIAVLADDAGNQGNELYLKLMRELVDWVSSKEMQDKYPGLKTTIPFCPVQYMGLGESWMTQMPAEVPVVMTGGKVWGEVTDNFTNAFYRNVGRGPYMWINWPCTDNSKRHLIMGGYTEFLHPGVNPEKIQGIVLNPMQQSEPSKVAIFGNACYSWNIWDKSTADQAWEDSFKYVDHETHEETEASKALRELSKHMINQNMTNGVVTLQESVELKPKLEEFKTKLAAGTLTQDDIDKMRQEFKTLAQASKTYREKGNPLIVKQIVYWLDTWDNITAAADFFLGGLQGYYIESDPSIVPTYFVQGQAQMEEAETHGYKYVDHTEYAEVGVQHIMPFMRTVRDHVGVLAKITVDPTAIIPTAITNRKDNPVGALSNLIDGNQNTEVIFKEGSVVNIGDYIGVIYNRAIPITDVKFVLGTRSNPADRFTKAKLMYTEDGSEWKPVPGADEFTGASHIFEVHNLNIKAKGIRLEATAQVDGKWFAAREIYVNDIPLEADRSLSEPINCTVVRPTGYTIYQTYTENNLQDASDDTFVWYSNSARKGDILTMQLPEKTPVGKIHIAVGDNSGGDKWLKYHLEYSEDGTGNWKRVTKSKIRVNDGVTVDAEGNITGKQSGKDIIDIELGGVPAKSVRLVNGADQSNWIKFSSFLIYPSNIDKVIHTPTWAIQENGSLSALTDGDDNTSVWFDPDGESSPNHDHSLKGEYIGVKLHQLQKIGKVRFVVGADNGDKWKKYHLEYSPSAEGDADWVKVRPFEGAQSGKDVIEVNLGGVEAQRVRMVNDEDTTTWVKFSEITVNGFDQSKEIPKHVFTNNAEAKQRAYGTIDDEQVSVSKAFEMTLQPGQYFGFELPRIRKIGELTVDAIGAENLTLKTGANLEEMSNYTEGDVNARYVYLQNNTDKPISFYLNALKAKITESKSIHFDSIEGFASGNKDSDAVVLGRTGNLFDGNVNTDATFARPQANNGTITYDLGQTREIRKLEALMKDAQRDFIRQGVIEVAESKEGPWTTVVSINAMGEDGNQYNEDTAGSIGWGESSSTYPNFKSYSGTLETPVNARYLRIRVTADYSHRWMNLSEIFINGGEYVPVNANPTFIANPAEVSADFLPQFAADGNVSTAFKPNMEGKSEGSLVYKLSTSTRVDQINILQSSAKISNAKVWVRGIPSAGADQATARAAEKGEWIEVGTLTEPLTSIYTYNFDSIYEIKLEWGAVQPIIYEIGTVANGVLEVDTTLLEKLLEKCKEIPESEKHNYEASALAAYEAARKNAADIIAAAQQGKVELQAKVNEAYGKLVAANKALLGGVTDLETARENLRRQLNMYDESRYTSGSWKTFINDPAYLNAVAVLEKNGSSIKEITDATVALVDAAERILVRESSSGGGSGSGSSSGNKKDEDKDDTQASLTGKPVLPVDKTVKVTANNGDVVSITTKKVGNGYVLSVKKDGKDVTNLPGGVTISLPTSETGMGVVAVIGAGDQQTVSRKSYLKDGNIVVTIDGSCTVQIENRAASFGDVTATNWFKNPVDFVTARNLFMGASQNTFAPSQAMNRGMLATVLYRLEGEPAVSGASAFKDVSSNQYYANAVAWAAKEGFVRGTSADKF